MTGWNENRAWKGGEEEKFGPVRKRTLIAARKKVVCPKANWFEVVASVEVKESYGETTYRSPAI